MIVHRHRWKLKSRRRLPGASLIRRIVQGVLRAERRPASGEINVIFTGRRAMTELHRRALNDSSDTDVMAFPFLPLPGEPKRGLHADIYICVPEAAGNARRFRQSFSMEVIRLLVHGTMHLIGYEDHSVKKRNVMWARQEALLRRLWNNRNF